MTLNTASVPVLAADLGFMSREGLDVDVVQFDGTPPALTALERGEIQFAQVNIAPAVDRVAAGAGLRAVWGLFHGDPFKPAAPVSPDAGLLLVSSTKFSNVEGLKGARIGIAMKGATMHHALIPIFKEHGIDPEKGVRWMEVGGTPMERVQMLLDGRIDAMVTTAQTLAAFEARKKDLKILANGRDFAKHAGVQFLIVVTTEEIVESRPEAVQSYVRGLITASRRFSESQQEWIAGAAKRLPQVPREAIVKGWEQSKGHWPVNGRFDPKAAEEAVARLKKSGEISAVPSIPAKEWVLPQFVDSALKKLGRWEE